MNTRWGREGETKQINVYSNCEEAELFVGGRSYGKKQRNSQDFPSAGLRWQVQLQQGDNELRVVATKEGVEVTDQMTALYQTDSWDNPAAVRLHAVKQPNGQIFLQAHVVDAKGIDCLDAALFVRFGLAGDGKLIDNLGTVHGSRLVQSCNGSAGIYLDPRGGHSIASASAEGLPTQFIEIQ
ncbi:MAG: glycoside hydrolase, partial [Bacilli bacterium]|nr:glycoside hydrolase [Bacilli bacterium]